MASDGITANKRTPAHTIWNKSCVFPSAVLNDEHVSDMEGSSVRDRQQSQGSRWTVLSAPRHNSESEKPQVLQESSPGVVSCSVLQGIGQPDSSDIPAQEGQLGQRH